MERAEQTQQVRRVEMTREVGEDVTPKDNLAARIARARRLTARGKKVVCADCYARGRDDAIAIIDGR